MTVEAQPDVFAEVLRRLSIIESEVDAIRDDLRAQRDRIDRGGDADDDR